MFCSRTVRSCREKYLPASTPCRPRRAVTKPAPYDGTNEMERLQDAIRDDPRGQCLGKHRKGAFPRDVALQPGGRRLDFGRGEMPRLRKPGFSIGSPLRGRFLQQLHAIQLRNGTQKPQECLQKLASDIGGLAQLTYTTCPEEVQDQLAQQRFFDASAI